ncbi:Rdx family protein [Sulfidibacter corallicola]|uniref:Rdx family protein n=1 Tax=Sulfidibacter corallicola TaxID=2818388 RepID=A0A8A4U6N1_SULCO|nr:Rdx family protein [Sulfidibacter corallicola]
MAAYLKGLGPFECELEVGSRGIFDVWVDGRLIFSKHREGRFPEHDEIKRILGI